jgi:nucleotide-binding universal stress UspA family protein
VPGVPVREQVETTTGSVSDAILRVVRENRSDLIVMGTHGRSGVKRVVLGSVAELVVRDGTQPVFLIPERAASARSAANPQTELEV